MPTGPFAPRRERVLIAGNDFDNVYRQDVDALLPLPTTCLPTRVSSPAPDSPRPCTSVAADVSAFRLFDNNVWTAPTPLNRYHHIGVTTSPSDWT